MVFLGRYNTPKSGKLSHIESGLLQFIPMHVNALNQVTRFILNPYYHTNIINSKITPSNGMSVCCDFTVKPLHQGQWNLAWSIFVF